MKIFAATMLSLLLVACATTREATLPRTGYGIEGVRQGDTVVVHLFNGKSHRFEVRWVDVAGIHGWSESYSYADMRSVEVVEHNVDTAAVLWALLGIGLLMALVSMPPVSIPNGFCVYSSSDRRPGC